MTEQPDLGQPVMFSRLVLKATLPNSKAGSAAFSAGARWRHGLPLRRDAAQGLAAIAELLSREGNLNLEHYTIHLEPLGKAIGGSLSSVGPLMALGWPSRREECVFVFSDN